MFRIQLISSPNSVFQNFERGFSQLSFLSHFPRDSRIFPRLLQFVDLVSSF